MSEGLPFLNPITNKGYYHAIFGTPRQYVVSNYTLFSQGILDYTDGYNAGLRYLELKKEKEQSNAT